MSDPIIQSSPIWAGERKYHQFQIMVPETCQLESQKVTNLRAQLAELEANMQEVDRVHDHLQLLSKAELVTAIIMETSIGFLDLAASLVAPINPAAGKVAKSGAAAVKSAKSVGEYSMGQMNAAQLGADLSKNGLSMVETKSIAGKVMLDQAKMHVDAASLAINAASGTDQAKLKQQGLDFAKDETVRNVELVGEAMGEASKMGKVSKALSLLDGVYTASRDYRSALDARFDTRIEQNIAARSSMLAQKAALKRMMSRISALLDEAIREFQACAAAV